MEYEKCSETSSLTKTFVTKITTSTITMYNAITAKNLFKKPKCPLKVMLLNYKKPYTT